MDNNSSYKPQNNSWIHKLFGGEKKYIILFTIFILYILLCENNVIKTFKHRSNVRKLEKQNEIYEEKINAVKQELELFKESASNLERLAREKYYMRQNNEDIFIIEE